MKSISLLSTVILLASLPPLSGHAAEAPAGSRGTVEVVHWWTSPGEIKAINVLKGLVGQDHYTWKDGAVAGGGGATEASVLLARAVSGNPPSAAQVKGLDLQLWGQMGLLTNLDAVSKTDDWDKLLPKKIADAMKYDSHYVAVPLNIHRVNWLWINPEVFKKAGIAKVPTTLEEFYAAGDKLKAAHFIALAHGGKPWQDGTIFEDLVLSILGPDGYKHAFVDLDEKTLTGPKMVEVFIALRKIQGYMDPSVSQVDWNLETDKVISGKAGMQIMGDWAKSEWTAAGKVAGKDYKCVPFPGSQGSFTYDIDSLAMFKLSPRNNTSGNRAAQNDVARIILEPEFQYVFNQNKGSIPVRGDLDMSKFDSCAQASMSDFKAASEAGKLQPSMAHSMATSLAVQRAIFAAVANFMDNPAVDPKAAVEKLYSGVQLAR